MIAILDTISFPMLITPLITLYSHSAETMPLDPLAYPREILYAELPAEIIRDEEQFKTIDDDDQLRHPQDHEEAKQKTQEKQQLEGNRSLHERQRENPLGDILI